VAFTVRFVKYKINIVRLEHTTETCSDWVAIVISTAHVFCPRNTTWNRTHGMRQTVCPLLGRAREFARVIQQQRRKTRTVATGYITEPCERVISATTVRHGRCRPERAAHQRSEVQSAQLLALTTTTAPLGGRNLPLLQLCGVGSCSAHNFATEYNAPKLVNCTALKDFCQKDVCDTCGTCNYWVVRPTRVL
jgi:hypothetical protein